MTICLATNDAYVMEVSRKYIFQFMRLISDLFITYYIIIQYQCKQHNKQQCRHGEGLLVEQMPVLSFYRIQKLN